MENSRVLILNMTIVFQNCIPKIPKKDIFGSKFEVFKQIFILFLFFFTTKMNYFLLKKLQQQQSSNTILENISKIQKVKKNNNSIKTRFYI